MNSTSVVKIQLMLAFGAVFAAVTGGVIGALHYIEPVSKTLNEVGLQLTALRPLHTTFAHLWIFGAALAVIYHYLSTTAPLTKSESTRFKFHTVCWLLAGLGVIVTLPMGITSGREYLGFHPAFSVVFLAGWIAFAWTFFSRVAKGFWSRPVYVYMWAIGILYFIYTFVEGHSYLLPSIAKYPVTDLQIQWKSCGTMVGSFNFLMYGCLIYVSEKVSGDTNYAHSKMAFALFGIGALNSFTNYAHHTYHLPQMELILWIAFIVSMIEILILLRVIQDVVGMVKKRMTQQSDNAVERFFDWSKWWTLGLLPISLLISVPPLNTFIHGTHVILGHGMGAELGIDTMVLLGTTAYLITKISGVESIAKVNSMKKRISALSFFAFVLVAWLSISGLVHGIYRYNGEPSPDWIIHSRPLFVIAGTGLAISLLSIIIPWACILIKDRQTSQPKV
ncbi:MAG: cbb3-type cytochrome c oxidase subunit I [Planctomycetota bacterium]